MLVGQHPALGWGAGGARARPAGLGAHQALAAPPLPLRRRDAAATRPRAMYGGGWDAGGTSGGGGGGPLPAAAAEAAPSASAEEEEEEESACTAVQTEGGPLQKDAKQLTKLLLQLSRLEVQPHTQWLEEVLEQVQAQMPALGSEDLCACMRALAVWGHEPGPVLLEALEARSLDAIARGSFTMRQLAELAWTYAQLGLKQRPLLPVILTAAEVDMRSDAGPSCPPESMADLVWAMARLQHQPVDGGWLAVFFAATQPRLREFSPQQSARTLWALARLHVVPPAPWMDAFLAASLAGLRGLDVKSMSLTLWALATLCGMGAPRPGRAWVSAFEGHAELFCRQLGAAEAATALWAFSQLTGKPPQELRLSVALRRPQLGLSQLDFELLADIRMLRVVRSMIVGGGGGGSAAAP